MGKNPSPAERLTLAEQDITKINALLEHLWLERHKLYATIRELKIVQRHIELARAELEKSQAR